MFKKFSAIVAALTIAFTGLTATAANASVTVNVGSNNYEGWQVYYTDPNTHMSNSSFSQTFPSGMTEMSMHVGFSFGKEIAKSLAGHDIRIEWHETFPGAMHWWSQTPSTGGTLSKSYRLSGNNGYWFDYNAPNYRDAVAGSSDPANSIIFTVPAGASNMSGNQSFDLQVGIDNWSGAEAGTYVIAPTLYDKTDGRALNVSTTESDSNIWAGAGSSYRGDKRFTSDLAPGARLTQYVKTCVNKSSIALNDVLALSPIVNGSFEQSGNWTQIYRKGTAYDSAGNFNQGNYTVQQADVAADSKGFRINTSVEYFNSTLSSVTAPSLGLSIRNTTQASAQIEASCAPAAVSAPTFTLTGRSNATISWPKSADDAGVSNTFTYTYSLYKASAPDVLVATEDLNPASPVDGIYSTSVYFHNQSNWQSIQVDMDTDYIVKISAKNNTEWVASPESPASNTQRVVTPSPIAAPTFTLTKVNGMFNASFEWNKAPGDIPTQMGRSVNYSYAIYAASDPNTAVASGSLYYNNMTPSNTGKYSKTVTEIYTNGMCCSYATFIANTNYVAKIKYYDMTSSVESAYSAASAPSMIVGPSAPPAPAISTINAGFITATFTAPAGKTGADGYSYRAFAYQENNITPPVPLANGTCMSTTPSGTAFTCNVGSPMGAFTAPNSYYVRVVASLNGIDSLSSAASAARVGGWPGVDLSPASDGVLDGDAKMYAPNVPGVMTTFGSRGTIAVDSRGGYYSLLATTAQDGNSTTFDFRKLKSDFTGWDTNFGSSGSRSFTISSNVYNGYKNFPYLPSLNFFAGSTKVGAFTSVSNCAPGQNNMNTCGSPNSLVYMTEATIGSTFSTPIEIGQKLRAFCTASADSDLADIYDASIIASTGFTNWSRPAATVTCSGGNSNDPNTYKQQFLVNVAADGTPTLVATLNAVDQTENVVVSTSISTNPNATGSDVETVILVTRGKGSQGSYGSVPTSSYIRKLIRVTADGTATEGSGAAYTVSGTEPIVRLAPVNDGTTLYATNIVSSMGTTTAKIMTAPVSAGNFTVGTALTLDVPISGSLSLSFPYNSVPNVDVPGQGEKLAFVRTDGGYKIAPMSYRVSNGTVVTGEQLNFSVFGQSLSYGFIAPNGNMYYMYSPAAEAVSHKVVRWNNVRTMVAVPTPTVTMGMSTYSLSAGGDSITITGLNFAETTAAKKVFGVKFGTVTVTAITKTATTVTVKIPAASAVGATAATPAMPAMIPISIAYGSSASPTYASAGVVSYIGAAKIPQTVTMTVSTALAKTTDADRTVQLSAGAIVPVQAGAPGIPVLSSTTPTICTIVDNKIHFVSDGNCIVKGTKAVPEGFSWLAEGSQLATIPVLKGDSATITFNEGESAAEGASEDDAIIPNITLASGRTDYTMTSSDNTKCSVNADTNAIWFKAGNQHCVITIATTGTVSGWAAFSYVWDVTMDPPVGDSAAGAILVRNDNKLTSLPGLGVTWDQKTNKVYFTTKVRRVGPVQVKMTFTGVDQVEYTCTSNFGILKKYTLPKVGPVLITSGALCTDTKNGNNVAMSAAEKTAQTLAYNKFKELSTAIQSGNGTNYIPVKFEYRRELHSAATYNLVTVAGFGPWSTPRYAKLNYRAIDKISAALPTGVTAAISTTEDGAVNPVFTLESKRTDFTVTSSDTTKCEVLLDARIWFKVAGQNCVLTIGTGTNSVWAGKSYTWTIPMVPAVGVSDATAPIAPSNGTDANVGPLTVVWTQASNSVVLKYNNYNPGLVMAKMTFAGLTPNSEYTCIVKFGSGAKVAAAALANLKTQAGPAFCTYVTGLSPAEKAAQTTAYTAFKALVAAKKAASQPVVVSIAYQFEAHSPLTGLLLGGQVVNGPSKQFSAPVVVKLNWRATAN